MHRIPTRAWAPAAAVAATLAAGCGSAPAPAGSTAPASGTAAPAATTSSTGGAAVATSTAGAAPGATAASLPCSSAPVEGTVTGGSGTARVTGVAAASHESAGYDRFVIRLSGAPTSYRVIPQGTPDFFEDASGRPVTLEGTAGVRIALQGVAGTPAYAGPTDLHPGLAQLREARQTGALEGVVSWGLGLAGPGCVRVQAPTAAAPTQLVVDVASR
ncbi:MAG TPA: hypothetical protein VGE42_00435 [Candidatus Dormibacteraeota bacterium]|jgi:hypothetical protein